MARASSVLLLTPEQHAKVDAIARRARFVDLGGILADLAEEGITISRSALHRYIQRLRRFDPPTGQAATLVVVIDTATGESTTVPLAASHAAVVAVLADLKTAP